MQDSLSSNEKAVYDRQIRLWGEEAQKRIQNAKVLVSGVSGTGAEICKNLVLSGINVTIHDDKLVDERDLGANFFLDDTMVGMNRAESSFKKLQALNTLVTVSILSNRFSSFKEDSFKDYSILILCDNPYSQETLSNLNKWCRKNNCSFLFAKSFGLSSILFQDLGETYEYYTLVDNKKNKRTQKFHTLDHSLSVPHTNTTIFPKSARKEVPPLFFSFSSLVKNEDLTTSEYLNGKENVEVNPVCAVVGGMIAQEVVKIISREGTPIANFFFYDARASRGVVRFIA